MKTLKDGFGRIHDYARISLIDRCNLNCIYCNPSGSGKNYAGKHNLLSAKEIIKLSEILTAKLGIRKIRLTGGEPLIRKDLPEILEGLKTLKDKHHFITGITTNGTGLGRNLPLLKKCGTDLLNISLDTLKPERFLKITGKPLFDVTMDSILKSFEYGFRKIKINTVIMKGINDDEPGSFIEFFSGMDVNIRFIEYMPFMDNGWNNGAFMNSSEMKDILGRDFTLLKTDNISNIAEDYKIQGAKCTVSFISPVSSHFCGSCNRLRITADGKIKSCLFSGNSPHSIKNMLADNNSDTDGICRYIEDLLSAKNYKHAEIHELTTLSKNNMLSIGG